MKYMFFFLAFFLSSLTANEIALKEKLNSAEIGSYLVTEQDKTLTLLHIYDRKGSLLVLEEVSIPFNRYPKGQSFREWFENGAVGHTSWLMSQINLQSGKVEETYSFPHQGWIDLTQTDSFLTTLLNLKFKQIKEEDRRRVGLPPGYNKVDHRPIWVPKMVVDGVQHQGVTFTAWKTRWPTDGSELSRKVVEVYLPETSGNAIYPTYFPYWLEVEGKIGSAKARVIDSGLNAKSPKPALPLRQPHLLHSGILNASGFSLTLSSPSYFQSFMILAEEDNAFMGQTVSLPCEAKFDQDQVTLFISRDEMEKVLKSGTSYRFLVSPEEAPSICLETKQPIEFR